MPSASRTIEIAAPISDVFTFFTTPANDRSWRAGVKEMRADGPPEPGSTVHQVIAGPGGRAINADIEITAYDVPSTYAFRTISGPVRPVGSYAFMSAGTGTRVTFTLEAELSGIKKLFMSRPVQKSMDAEMSALDKARAILEG